jgi:hypothetical protein
VLVEAVAPPASSVARTADVDEGELRELRAKYEKAPFRELKPTERAAAARPKPEPASAASAAPATPFERRRRTPAEPFATKWSEAFLLALAAEGRA